MAQFWINIIPKHYPRSVKLTLRTNHIKHQVCVMTILAPFEGKESEFVFAILDEKEANQIVDETRVKRVLIDHC